MPTGGRGGEGEENGEAAAEERTLSQGTFDPEMPYKPEWSCSPRSLAVHPEGLEVRAGVWMGTELFSNLSRHHGNSPEHPPVLSA